MKVGVAIWGSGTMGALVPVTLQIFMNRSF